MTALPGGQVTPPEYRDGFSEPLHSSLRTKLSSLLKEIHESICDKHFVNTEEPKPKRFKHSVVSPDKAVPTAKDVGNAHGIDVVKIPSMSLSDILDMLRELFGPDQELIETFRKEVSFLVVAMEWMVHNKNRLCAGQILRITTRGAGRGGRGAFACRHFLEVKKFECPPTLVFCTKNFRCAPPTLFQYCC